MSMQAAVVRNLNALFILLCVPSAFAAPTTGIMSGSDLRGLERSGTEGDTSGDPAPAEGSAHG